VADGQSGRGQTDPTLCYARSVKREVGIEMKNFDWFIPLYVMHYAKVCASGLRAGTQTLA